MKSSERTIKAWGCIKDGKLLRNGQGELMLGTKKRATDVMHFLRHRKQSGIAVIPCEIHYTP